MRSEYIVNYKTTFDGGWEQLTIPASEIPGAKAFVATHRAPNALSRIEYEARCEAAEIDPAPDAWIKKAAYSIRYGEFSVLSYAAREVVRMHLAKMRLNGIDSERVPVAESTIPARETFVCPGCGGIFPRSAAMNASTAMTCPNCYDDFS